MPDRNFSMYEGYDELKGWDSFFKPSFREAQLFAKEFRKIELTNKYFIDIGFGSGALVGWAMEQRAIVAGVEIQEKLLEAAQNCGVKAFSILNEAPSNTYDVVTAFDVMEHVPLDEIPVFLNEVYRVAKSNATVMFRFPNCQSPAGLICQFGDHTHVSMLSGPFMAHMFKKAGFINIAYNGAQIIKSRTWANRFARVLLTPVIFIFELLFRLALFDRDTPLTPNIIVIAKKP